MPVSTIVTGKPHETPNALDERWNRILEEDEFIPLDELRENND